MVSVPNVVGLTQPAATSAITGAGLVLGTVTMASSATVPKGSVIAQSPVGGTKVAKTSAVNLSVSTGPPPVAVPNVVGLTLADATTAITAAGLVLGTVKMARSDTVPSGSVISQSPAAGTSVARGSAVNLTVSRHRRGSAVIIAPAAVVAYSPVILDGTTSGDRLQRSIVGVGSTGGPQSDPRHTKRSASVIYSSSIDDSNFIYFQSDCDRFPWGHVEHDGDYQSKSCVNGAVGGNVCGCKIARSRTS
jgi:hypothetical protein